MAALDRAAAYRPATLKRAALLASCTLAGLPASAWAQDRTNVDGPSTTVITVDGTDEVNIGPNGSINSATLRSIIYAGTGGTGAGPVISNAGTLGPAATNANVDYRAIDTGSTNFANRSVTVINSGTIVGNNDAIRLGNITTGATATPAAETVVRITNTGTIRSNATGPNSASWGIIVGGISGGRFDLLNSGTISSRSGVSTNAGTFNLTNNAGGTIAATTGDGVASNGSAAGNSLTLTNGGTISGTRGVFSAGGATILNNGTITGTGAVSGTATSTGEGIRLNATVASTVTLGAASTTSTSVVGGNAIAVFGAGGVTVNINAGAAVNGAIRGFGGSGPIDTLNLLGAAGAAGTLGNILSFEQLNVRGGTWGTTFANGFAQGATIDAGAIVRLDTSDTSSGEVRGALTNNGQLVFNRLGILTQAAAGNAAGTLPSGIAGTGSITFTNTGTYDFAAGANSYSGATVLDGTGRLRALGVNAFSPNSAVTVTGNAALALAGFDQTIADLSGDGSVRTNNDPAAGESLLAGTLTTGGGNGTVTYSGVFTGAGGLTKVGTGTTTLSGANNATGLLRANGGRLIVAGSYAAGAEVNAGGTLGGAGTIAGAVTVANGGILAPGNAGIGTLTTGNLTLAAGSTLALDFGAPRNADRIVVNGDLVLDGTLNVTDVGGFGQGVYRLIDYTGGLTDNGLSIGTVPVGQDRGQMTIQTGVSQQVNLVYGSNAAPPVQFWDGPNLAANGVVDGGTGSWTNRLPNWTSADGTDNGRWQGNFAVFQGATGTVTVDDAIQFAGLQFITDGYVLAAGSGGLNAVERFTNLRVDPGVTGTISAAIAGSGIIKNDAGTIILSGSNSYTGATNVAGGTLRIAATAALPAATVLTVQAGATLDLAADATAGSLAGAGTLALTGGRLSVGGLNSATTFAGTVAGSGGLTKVGTAILTLTGAATNTGATIVSAGTLTAGATGVLGTGGLSVAANASANLAGFAQTVGAIDGAGRITLGAGGSLTSVAATDTTFSGPITGAGATLTKQGTGALTLTGTTLAFTGTAVIDGGRLVVGNAGALNNGLAVVVNGGGTLEIAVDKRLGSVTGTGALVLGGSRLTLGGGDPTTFAGSASGTGGITQAGPGTLTLAGTNTYTGDTVAAAGTLLIVGSATGTASVTAGAALGGTGTIVGTVTVADGATLAPGVAGAGTLTTGGLQLGANATLAYDLGAPGVAGASDRIQVGGNLTLDGVLNVNDVGGFGVGVYRLIDYTGGLTDNGLVAGTLPSGYTAASVEVQTSVANQINLVVSGQIPEVQFWDGASLAPNGRVDGGTASWTNRLTNWTNPAGDQNVRWGGRFAVFQGTAGTVAVDDAIRFTGLQFVTSGYTVAAGSGALEAVDAASAIRVDPGVTATIAASITGTGGLRKLDSGTLVLAGANGYAGATAVEGGTLRVTAAGALPGTTTVTLNAGTLLDVRADQAVASIAGTGAVTLTAATLTTGGNNADGGFAGTIGGTGGIAKAGTGTLTLTGVGSYTGGTTVAGGTLAVGTGGRLGGGALSVATGATLNLGNVAADVGALSGGGTVALGSATLTTTSAAASSFAGGIIGTGGLTKAGTGNLTLAGTNTFTGATTINGGTLTLSSAGALPNAAAVQVAAGATLALGASRTLGTVTGAGNVALGAATLTLGAGEIGGTITGTGGISKTGTGTLTLAGQGSYTGPTTVAGGLLTVNGTLVSTATVATGARLGGIGRVGGLVVNGTVAPGNGIGTLQVAGNLTFNAGSTYQVDVTPQGRSDLIAATGAVTVNGGTVQVLTGGATDFGLGIAYTVVTGGSVSGAFAGVTSDLAFLTPSLRYAPTAVTLVLQRNDVQLMSVAQTRNQRSVALALGRAANGTLFDQVLFSSAAASRTLFDQVSGEIHADSLNVANRGEQTAQRQVLGHLAQPARRGPTVWLDVESTNDDVKSRSGYAAVDGDRTTQMGGVDYLLGRTRIGIGLRHARDGFDLDARASRGTIDTDAVFLYAGQRQGPVQLSVGGSFARHDVRVRRGVAASASTGVQIVRERGDTQQLFGEIAYTQRAGEVRWGPFAGIAYAKTRLDGAVESGGGSAALRIDEGEQASARVGYGVRASGPLTQVVGRPLRLDLEIGGATFIDDTDRALRTLRFADTGAVFDVEGAGFGRQFVTTRIGASLPLLGGQIGASFNGEMSNRSRSYGGRVSAGWQF